MKNIFSSLFLLIITSFYFFPFEFTFLPGINTKMIMAGIGLVLLGINLGRSKESVFNRDIFFVSLFAAAVSLAGYTSATYNGTADYSYASYLVSMWVWLSGAYVAVSCMRWIHGKVDCQLICDYLIAVCVAQCLIAFSMEFSLPLKNFVDSFLGGEGFMGKNDDRLYGIGAALDVAGSRFSAVLVMIAFLCSHTTQYVKTKTRLIWYLTAFAIILVIGNMIARTTTIGSIFAIILFFSSTISNSTIRQKVHIWSWAFSSIIIFAVILGYFYQTNELVHQHIRFAFEGFFSLIEEGHWEVKSNNSLLSHWEKAPASLKTWVIGDGYFQGHNFDPFYIGRFGFFYGDTDVGYLRFIYYFGLTGLICFISFLCYVTYVCSKKSPSFRNVFICCLLINLCVWAKVSTDIFLVFAPFLCISSEENEEFEERIKLSE